MRAIHRWLVNSSLKGPLKWQMFPFDDVIMLDQCGSKAAMSPNMSLLLCNGTCCRCRGFYSADQNVQKHKFATQQPNIICHSIRCSSMTSQTTFLKMFSLLIIVSLICLTPLCCVITGQTLLSDQLFGSLLAILHWFHWCPGRNGLQSPCRLWI